jgi:Fe-S cluster assembly protein SufD
MAGKDFYIEKFKDIEKQLNGEKKTFFHQLRLNALNQLAGMNFPTQKNEEWKYTDVSPIVKENFVPSIKSKLPNVNTTTIHSLLFKNFDFHLLVFINGIYNAELSKINSLPEGVLVGSLANILKYNPEIIKQYLNKNSKISDAFDALNLSYSFDGTVVIIPDGIIVEAPIQILFLNSSAGEPALTTSKNLIVLGKNSQANIIANYRAESNEKYLNNTSTEIFVDEDSILNYYKIQNEKDDSFHIEKLFAEQKNRSVFNHYNFNFGGSIVRNDLNTVLNGENIETHYYGLYMVNGKQHIDNHTFVDHAKPNCMSNELYKGILDDSARGVFNGKIIVRPDAQKTNAYQQNKTILLSKTAAIDTKPQLEIFADDVKCSHGATVGHLDDASEFYIRSRGIPQELAKSMLIRAFANDVIETIKIEPFKEQINHLIFEHLHKIEIKNEE